LALNYKTLTIIKFFMLIKSLSSFSLIFPLWNILKMVWSGVVDIWWWSKIKAYELIWLFKGDKMTHISTFSKRLPISKHSYLICSWRCFLSSKSFSIDKSLRKDDVKKKKTMIEPSSLDVTRPNSKCLACSKS